MRAHTTPKLVSVACRSCSSHIGPLRLERAPTLCICLPLTRTVSSNRVARSVHHIQDQGWSGHLGLTSFNVANLKAAAFVGKEPRSVGT